MKDNSLILEQERTKVNKILTININNLNAIRAKESEKILQEAIKIAEKLYIDTNSLKDRNLVLKCYDMLVTFYDKYESESVKTIDCYTKIINLLEESGKYNIEDYYNLIERYIELITIFENKNYNHGVIDYSKSAMDCAKHLYSKSKTFEDLRYVILINLFNARAYKKLNKKFKSYCYFRKSLRLMEKVYKDYKEEGIKNDIIAISYELYNLTTNRFLIIINKKWKYKIVSLKENIK